jgi:hypothetical protein
LNRSDFSAVTQHNISVEHHMTDTERDRRIIALCNELGLPETEARKMLISPDKIQDAEFRVLEPEGELQAPPTEATAKRERKNDLLRERRRLFN